MAGQLILLHSQKLGQYFQFVCRAIVYPKLLIKKSKKSSLKHKYNILFLGEGPNNLALMAEVFARNEDTSTNCNLTSASMTPFIPNKCVAKVIHEKHLDLNDRLMHSILEIELFNFDLVITIGDFDQDCRPNLPGMPPHIHWDVPDPKTSMSEKKHWNFSEHQGISSMKKYKFFLNPTCFTY